MNVSQTKWILSLSVAISIASLPVAPSLVRAQTAGQTTSVSDLSEEDFNAHVEEMARAREEQNAFFAQMQEDIANGVPVDVAGGSCTYVSSIFNPPPPKTVVLTFDDGPSEGLTPEVLAILKKHNIKATFFNIGEKAKANTAMVKRVVSEGHIVGNHSWSHPDFHKISEGTQASEVTTTDAVLAPYMPKGLKLFRYPYGNSSCATNSLVRNTMHYTGIVGWHIDSCDWAFASTGSVSEKYAKICEVAPQNVSNFVGHVLTEVRRHNGGIILLHEIHTRTVANLEAIINGLEAGGYKFANLDDPRMKAYFR